MKGYTVRILALLILLCMSVTLLASCFLTQGGDSNGGDGSQNGDGDNNGDEAPTEITVISKDQTVNLMTAVGASDGVTECVDMIASAIESLGVTVNRALDIQTVSGTKIYIGDTSHASCEACKNVLEMQGIDENYVAYVIHTCEGALAIYANRDSAYPMAAEYLIENHLTSDTVKLNDDSIINIFKMTIEDYESSMAEIAWEHRWDSLERKYGVEVVNSFKRLYAFYGDSVYKWIANLYDIENGGFYYANSARDYEGFLPDIESTTQALWLITASGLTSHLDNDLTVALPKDIVDQTLNFVYSLYDESDGYFYHPQWGKNIGSSRKGRDINSSIDVIKKLGGTVPEDNALNRLNGTASTPSAVAKVVSANSSVKAVNFLSSQSALLNWLNERNINKDSHGAGHTIESSASQIKAAGYSQFVIDWLDSKQLETGLWEELNPNNPYSALSGLLKIGSCYKTFGGQMKRCDSMIDTAISTILSSVDPYIVIYVYNPWGGLKYALNNMLSANKAAIAAGEPQPYDYDAQFAKVIEAFPDMINVTIEKLNKFQKDDGSFSYYQGVSAAYTQGTHVSLGFNEGDVNGTSLGMTTMYTTLYEILGTSVVPLYNEDDYNEFIEILTTLEPQEKNPRPKFEAVDFENGELGTYISTYSTTSGMSTIAVDDDGEGNNALRVVSPSGVGDQVTFKADGITDGMVSFSFDFDMKITTDASYSHQISMLDNTGAIAVMMTVHSSNGKISFRDTSSNSHYYGAYYFTETANVGEWFHVRMEYHILDDSSTRFVLYINDNYAGESTNYYGKYDSAGNILVAEPKVTAERLQIYAMMSVNTEFFLDNMDYEFYATSTYE